MKKLLFTAAAASIMITQTGCFGSFALIQKVYEFNDDVSDNKFVKSLVFWVMAIIPVYGIAGFLDVVIFNLIEFWSGSNPVAMAEGEVETQYATIKGDSYKITATKNQMKFEKVVGDDLVDMGAMVFSEDGKTWSFVKDDKSQELITFNGENIEFNTEMGVQSIHESNLDCYADNKNYIATELAMN